MNQKGSKLQSKTPQPSPTTCSASPKPPITEENQPNGQPNEPDAVSTTTKETESTKNSSPGLYKSRQKPMIYP